MNPRIKNLLFSKVREELSDCVLFMDQDSTIWFASPNKKNWFLIYYPLTETLTWSKNYFDLVLPFFSIENDGEIITEFFYDLIKNYDVKTKVNITKCISSTYEFVSLLDYNLTVGLKFKLKNESY